MEILTRLIPAFALTLLPGLALCQSVPYVAIDLPAVNSGVLASIMTQLIYACIPLSVAVQVHGLCKLQGGLNLLARLSAFAMAALWIFVIVTGIAGDNFSPAWLVILSPVFVAWLFALLVAQSIFHLGENAALAARPMQFEIHTRQFKS